MTNAIAKLFQQKSATLFNGQIVREGDRVQFINSDKELCTGIIQRRKFDTDRFKKGTLFFWNSTADIKDYTNATNP